MGTTTTGVCGTLLASAPLYMCFPLSAEKASPARVIAGDSASCPPRDTPRVLAMTGGCHPGFEACHPLSAVASISGGSFRTVLVLIGWIGPAAKGK